MVWWFVECTRMNFWIELWWYFVIFEDIRYVSEDDEGLKLCLDWGKIWKLEEIFLYSNLCGVVNLILTLLSLYSIQGIYLDPIGFSPPGSGCSIYHRVYATPGVTLGVYPRRYPWGSVNPMVYRTNGPWIRFRLKLHLLALSIDLYPHNRYSGIETNVQYSQVSPNVYEVSLEFHSFQS